MTFDPETHRLFDESNFDPYDSGTDRYAGVLREGLRQHGQDLSDVLAVTQDLGLWAICRNGLFRADMRGVFKKRIEVDDFIPYSQVHSVREEPSGSKTSRLVLIGRGGTELARIDFSAGGMDNTPAIAAAHRDRIYQILEQVLS